MNKSNILLRCLLSLVLTLFSCKNEKKLPHSKGETAEILVVTNNKEQWNSEPGKAIKEFFGQTQYGLPQPEPLFSLFHLPEEAFIKMYQANRDILILDIGTDIAKARVEIKKDLWAAPQRVIKISAPDQPSFLKIFEEHKQSIMQLFFKIERERMNKAFKSAENVKLRKALEKNYQLSLTMPAGYRIAKQTENFVWIRKETLEESQGILIYTDEYTDKNTFTLNNILHARDKITRKYIPGPAAESFMKVAREFIPPQSKEINFNDFFAVETRGLWEVENDFMGGPFLHYTLVDEKQNRVINLDAYVYAPNAKKRNLLLQLEAILHTFRLINQP